MRGTSLRREIPLMLAAVFIAFVIWLIAVQRDRDTTWVKPAIGTEKVPLNMKVEVDPPETLVNVQFPRDQRNWIEGYNFPAIIDVSDVIGKDLSKFNPPDQPRIIPYNLSLGRDVRPASNLPHEIQVLEISPYLVNLKVTLSARKIPVEVVTTGTLDTQLQFSGAPVPQPAEVWVTASPEVLARLPGRLQTEPLDISSVDLQTRLLTGRLRVLDAFQLINEADRNVSVNIGVEEKPATRIVEGVPVKLTWLSTGLTIEVTPPKVNITIEGPPSALIQISQDSFAFTPSVALDERPGKRQVVGIQAKLLAKYPPDVSQKIKISQVEPPRIEVEFLPVKPQTVVPAASDEP